MAERLPLSSIGFRCLTWKSAAFALLAAVAVTAVMVVEFAVVIPLLHLNRDAIIAKQQAILRTPYWYRVLLVLRAAVVEEILYRGYLIEKVRQLSGSTGLAVIVSISVFAFAHLRGWGPAHLMAVGAGGAIFAFLYICRRDLLSNMFVRNFSIPTGLALALVSVACAVSLNAQVSAVIGGNAQSGETYVNFDSLPSGQSSSYATGALTVSFTGNASTVAGNGPFGATDPYLSGNNNEFFEASTPAGYDATMPC